MAIDTSRFLAHFLIVVCLPVALVASGATRSK
jgi:hypothetical protein